MKIIVDVNLAVRWAKLLTDRRIEAVHWAAIGAANAQDTEIMSYAIDQNKTRVHILPFAARENE